MRKRSGQVHSRESSATLQLTVSLLYPERTHPIVSFHASLYNNFSISSGISDYTETRQQKMKRGFKFQRAAKEWERAFLEKMQGSPGMTFQPLSELYLEDKFTSQSYLYTCFDIPSKS